MDWLDRISIWAIVILIISSFALMASHLGEARPERNLQQRSAVAENPVAHGEIDGRVKLARNLMEANNLDKAETLIRELLQKYPYEGELRMALGDIFVRRQEAVKAMLEYKEAIDLNPDYLDKKTPLFQGKKMKIAVNEAMGEIERGLRKDPGNETLKKDRKIIYYLQRRIAGSCA